MIKYVWMAVFLFFPAFYIAIIVLYNNSAFFFNDPIYKFEKLCLASKPVNKIKDMCLFYKPVKPTTGIDSDNTASRIKGIYLTQYTLENTVLLNYLIKHAKTAGINTFVIDFEKSSKRYRENINLVKENNIRYVARIVMFPDGGTPKQILDPSVWQKKYSLVEQAIDLGANQIQLDYIRYNTKQKPSEENAKNIHKIIQWYKNKLSGQNIPLQVDVFGVTSFGESKYIGQNIKLFSQSVDAICPMVYPSHYDPYPLHFRKPYETVHDSLQSIKQQFNNKMPIKMYAYIELSNYHFPMSRSKKIEYIKAQIKAVEAANADGWYAWSPHNRYDHLFSILENKTIESEKPDKTIRSEKSSVHHNAAIHHKRSGQAIHSNRSVTAIHHNRSIHYYHP